MKIVMDIKGVDLFAPPLSSLMKTQRSFHDMALVDAETDQAISAANP
jgi:hypothetical protein